MDDRSISVNDAGAAALDCVGVTKAFGPERPLRAGGTGPVVALRGVDLSVPPGALTAVLGPSGCGKTTILRVIAGFERLDAGTVTIAGRQVASPSHHLSPEKRRVTIVPQEQALFPHMTVAENIGYGVGRGPERARAVEAMLDLTGLGGLSDRMPHELSGGQQQRVALARALAPTPSLVLLDEPFGSLDAALRAEIRADVCAALRASGATALLVTHEQEEALSMADTVAVMRDGVIVQHAPPADVYQRPADVWVARFVGGANVLEGRMAGRGSVDCGLGRLAVVGGPPSGTVDVVFRPEQLRVARAAPQSGDSAGDQGVQCLIEERRYFGHDTVMRVRLPDGSPVLARLASADPHPTGAHVRISCADPVLCFSRDVDGGASD